MYDDALVSTVQSGRADADAFEFVGGGADQPAAEVDQRTADRDLVADLRNVALAGVAARVGTVTPRGSAL
ncbi:MAG TPA: hypothetical protein VN779_22990 [Actinocrinis sp.]|nr:hypothetical protein [Actinocrinis sp.]HXR73673.1 hypothetical protein [Actinocrinis sp.]